MNASRLLSLSAALTVCPAVAGHARPLVLTGVPVARAAAQLSARFGVSIRLQKYSWRRVSLTIEDPDAPGARLEAVNALANAAGLVFTKSYDISKGADGGPVAPAVDSAGPLPVQPGTLPAREAIAMVAGVDDATAQVAGDVGGTVTLSGSPLTVSRAAAEIAQQTGTIWRTSYVLAARSAEPTGRVVGYTDGGIPIIQLSYVYYVDPQKEAEKQRAAEAAERQADQEQQTEDAAAQKAAAVWATVNQQAMAQQATGYQQAMAQRMGLVNPYAFSPGYSPMNGVTVMGGAYGNGAVTFGGIGTGY